MTVFTGDGKQETKDAYERKKYLDSLKINMVAESEVESDEEEQQRYLDGVKKNLKKNQDVDTELAKQKLKEKRIKSKKRLRKQEGEADEGVELGRASDDDRSELSQSDDSSPQHSEDENESMEQSQDESSEEEPVAPPTKRQKGSTEERALALLKKQSLF